MAAKDYINLEMPSILGMGAVGPTLAVLTASVYQALDASMNSTPGWAYPLIMLILAGLLAIFPTSRANFPKWQKMCLWPLAAIVIFSAAWGTNHGLSSGEETLNNAQVELRLPSLVGSAYAQTTNESSELLPTGPLTNQVNFAKLDMSTKKAVPEGVYSKKPKSVWGISWPRQGAAVLRDEKGKWWFYRKKAVESQNAAQGVEPDVGQQVRQKPLRGGFFKRF